MIIDSISSHHYHDSEDYHSKNIMTITIIASYYHLTRCASPPHLCSNNLNSLTVRIIIIIITSLSSSFWSDHSCHLTVCVWPRLGWHWLRARLGGGCPAPPGLGWLSTLSHYYINILSWHVLHCTSLYTDYYTLIVTAGSNISTGMVCVLMRARPMEWQGESRLPSLSGPSQLRITGP